MRILGERLRFPWESRQQWEGIDMGNGRVLQAEDVVEGHFRRLATARRTLVQAQDAACANVRWHGPGTPRKDSQKNVAVQISDDEFAAITVLAPNLAPLTDLAEEVASLVPPVQPAPAFRTHLHQALEQTHRQQAAQRVLGTRARTHSRTNHNGWVVVGILVLAIMLIWRRYTTQS